MTVIYVDKCITVVLYLQLNPFISLPLLNDCAYVNSDLDIMLPYSTGIHNTSLLTLGDHINDYVLFYQCYIGDQFQNEKYAEISIH